MYEVADGPRIQMWQALTTTDKLPVSSSILADLVSKNSGGKEVSFKPMERMQSNLLSTVGSGTTITLWLGFAFSYLIITVVPGHFSLAC